MLTLFITSSVLILGVFCLRKLTFGRISMRARYMLWLPVALRLLFPFSVGESPISVINVFSGGLPETQQIQTILEERDAVRADSAAGIGGYDAPEQSVKAGNLVFGQNGKAEKPVFGQGAEMENRVSGQDVEAGERAQQTKTEALTGILAKYPYFLRIVLGGVWLIGFLSVGCYMLLSTHRFMRYLKKNRSELSEEALPQEFTKRLSVRGMKVYQVQGLPSPCLVGGHIYVGGRAADDPQSLSHILAHEYSHARHLDRFWAFLRSFLTALYWFDPFVRAAAYAARQDSELACDEAAVGLLGESERFVYGRTLLHLLESGNAREECPGMTFMLNRDENDVRERIGALAGCVRKKGAAPVLAFVTTLLLCGCAFTGAAQGDAKDATVVLEEVKDEAAGGQDAGESGGSAGENGDSEQMPDGSAEEQSSETDEAAFEEALNYRGVMEGKDDSELFLNREVDYQTYFKYVEGEAENPMENGWYLICRSEEAGISLYGLYTEEFGFRGLKTLIGEDVNTYDFIWCASPVNPADDNIRVLEQAEDGLPRRFVWKLLAEESSTVEKWRLYSGYRYDTGTVDVKMLSEEECMVWAKEHLTFEVDREAAKVSVICDGDMDLGTVDISAYRDWETEGVQIVPDVTDFVLNDRFAGLYSDVPYEGTAVHLSAGLKLKGLEGLWWDGLPVLAVQVVEDEKSATGFRLEHPRIDTSCVVRAFWQEKELSELRDEIVFINPCPDYDVITAWYGEGIDPATGKSRGHTGVDMAAAEGTDILAAADGTVSMTGFDAEMGNYVMLRHEQSGQMTYYEHCKTVEVEKGQQVAQGEKIATVGQTGRATGPCLHFAVSSETGWEEPHFLELN